MAALGRGDLHLGGQVVGEGGDGLHPVGGGRLEDGAPHQLAGLEHQQVACVDLIGHPELQI